MNKSEKENNKRKYGKLPGIITAAFLAAAVTFCLLVNVEKQMLSDYEKELVWIAAGDLQKSLEINEENLGNCFQQTEVDKKIIPESAIKDLTTVENCLTAIMIPKGSILTETMFEYGEKYVDHMTNPVIAGCKADDLFQAVSGVLRKGDLINIYTVNEELGETYLLWSRVLVYQTFDSGGNLIAPEDTVTAAARINVLIEEGNAEQFYNEINNGSLRMVKIWDT